MSAKSNGQLGVPFNPTEAVATCASTCAPVSSVSFISFADATAAAVQVSAGDEHTCVLLASGFSVCFGNGGDGRLGTNGVANVSGPGGPTLVGTSWISFSEPSTSMGSIMAGTSHTCVVRCNGAVMCFGLGATGALGRDGTASYGDSPASMAALTPIAFDPTKIPTALMGCSAILINLKESTMTFNAFAPHVTFYIHTVPSDTDLIFISIADPKPNDALVTSNGMPITDSFPLSFHRDLQVRVMFIEKGERESERDRKREKGRKIKRDSEEERKRGRKKIEKT